jgi:NAD+ kinase
MIKAARPDESIKLTLDGQQAIIINSNEIVKVTKKKTKVVRLVKNPSRTYFRTLKEKFTHGAREIK